MVKFFVEPDERYQRSPTREGVGGVVKFFQERTARPSVKPEEESRPLVVRGDGASRHESRET